MYVCDMYMFVLMCAYEYVDIMVRVCVCVLLDIQRADVVPCYIPIWRTGWRLKASIKGIVPCWHGKTYSLMEVLCECVRMWVGVCGDESVCGRRWEWVGEGVSECVGVWGCVCEDVIVCVRIWVCVWGYECECVSVSVGGCEHEWVRMWVWGGKLIRSKPTCHSNYRFHGSINSVIHGSWGATSKRHAEGRKDEQSQHVDKVLHLITSVSEQGALLLSCCFESITGF